MTTSNNNTTFQSSVWQWVDSSPQFSPSTYQEASGAYTELLNKLYIKQRIEAPPYDDGLDNWI